MMLVKKWLPYAGLLILIAIVMSYQLSTQGPVEEASYPIQRTIKYSFTLKNPNSYFLEHSKFWVYSPLKESAFQRLGSIQSSHPYYSESDGQGNQRLLFDVDDLAPYGSRTISITAKVMMSSQPNQVASIKKEDYLGDEALVEKNHFSIKKVAHNLQAESSRDTVTKIYEWVVSNLQRTGYVKLDQGALHALKHRSGDCTEFMYLFSALSRANEIPSRNLAGFVVSEDKILRSADYHNWAEVYVDGEWYLVDPEKQVFMEKSSEYIAMRVLSESSLDQTQGSQTLFISSSEIEILMN